VPRLAKPRSYLTPDDQQILTDYALADVQVVAGAFPVFSSPIPSKPTPIVLVVFGGEVMVNGTRVIAENANMAEQLKEGGEYLLFLKKLGTEPGRYRPYRYGMFRIERGHATAVIKQAKEIFPGASEAPLADLVSKIPRG
jgi:hypothetical protein